MSLHLILSLCLTAGAEAPADSASAQATSLVLIVANNRSAQVDRPPLQYADDDGAKYYQVFAAMAGAENTVLLTQFDRDTGRLFPSLVGVARTPTRAQIALAAQRFADLASAFRKAGRKVNLYFIYAGHGDVDQGRGFLELADGPFTSDDLDALLKRIDASETHVILDSCNSFFVVNPRKPGGRRFATPRDAAENLARRFPNVGVFLSTSAEAEVFEWSELQSGVFSHTVRSGLLGAADADHDGRVSYQELAAFVETAAAEIKNPLFRPKVFARGPSGNDQRTLLDLSPVRPVVLTVKEPEAVRLAMRDGDGLRWLDAYQEPDVALELRLPRPLADRLQLERLKVSGPDAGAVEARYAVSASPSGKAMLAALSPATSSSEPRGAGDVFRALFTRPFGPKALAAYLEERTQTPEPVYGISRDDAERMGLLLEQLASTERHKRYVQAVGQLAFGTAFAAYSGLATQHQALRSDEKTEFSVVGIATPALFLGTGIYEIARSTDGEKLYQRFRASSAEPGADRSRIAAETEAALQAILEDEQRLRRIGLLIGWIGTGLGTSLVVLNEMNNDASHDARIIRRGELVGLTAYLLAYALTRQFSTSPTEKLIDLWQKDPVRQAPVLSIAPGNGGGLITLSGQF